MNSILFIEPSKFKATREELERYSPDIKSHTVREYQLPSFKKILRLNTNQPQKIFDCFNSLGQFAQYKSSQ